MEFLQYFMKFKLHYKLPKKIVNVIEWKSCGMKKLIEWKSFEMKNHGMKNCGMKTQTRRKLQPCNHWPQKYFQIAEEWRLDHHWICGKFQLYFYKWPLFCMLIVEILQLVFQKGLNQLNFLCNDAYISNLFKI